MQQAGDDPYYQSPLSYQRQKVSPRRRKRFQVGCAGAMGLVIVGILIGFLLGANVEGNNQILRADIQAGIATLKPAQAARNADTTAMQPGASGTWVTTHTFTGVGNEKTEDFTVGTPWKLQWSCGSGTTPEKISIDVDNSDGLLVDMNAINTACNVGNTGGETVERQSGSMYLDIKSEGGWTVQILELQ